jgi:predicted amidophosphoribosyltransferase
MRVTEITAEREKRLADRPAVVLAHCPSCGAPVNDGSCRACGAAVAYKKNCGACGAEAEPGARFCPDCGRGV